MLLFAFKEMHAGGGAEKNLIEVALHFAEKYRVGFLISGGYVDPRMAAAGPVFVMPGGGRFWAAPIDLLHLAWIVLRHRVRLVHAHHRYPAFMASLLRRLLGFKLVTTVHNRFPNRARASLWGDRAIAVSEDIAQWLRTECGMPPEMVVTIHNGIHTPPRHSDDERAALRAGLQVPDGAKVVLAIGRFSEQKNFSQLLDALAALKRTDWVLWLVGEGEQQAMLEQRIDALGLRPQVHLLGRRSDVPLLMQSADLLAMSSLWEGFPYVVVEALANGLPMVAADVGGVREGVIPGRTGWLVPKADTGALTSSLAAALDDPAARSWMQIKERELFNHLFRVDAMFRNLDAEIGTLLRKR